MAGKDAGGAEVLMSLEQAQKAANAHETQYEEKCHVLQVVGLGRYVFLPESKLRELGFSI